MVLAKPSCLLSIWLSLSILPQKDSQLFGTPKCHLQSFFLPALALTTHIGFSPKKCCKISAVLVAQRIHSRQMSLSSPVPHREENPSHWLAFTDVSHPSEKKGKLSPKVNFHSSSPLDTSPMIRWTLEKSYLPFVSITMEGKTTPKSRSFLRIYPSSRLTFMQQQKPRNILTKREWWTASHQ